MKAQDEEIKEKLKEFKNKILVMSGKGGVGKSTVAAYLAVGLARKGFQVGLMDVDLHGPSIPRLLGLKGEIVSSPGLKKGIPLSYLPNMQVMSIESLLGDKDTATIWRGPLKIGVIKQFINISLSDVRKSINFCRQVNMNIIGLIENMSGLTCPYCGKTIDLFKTDGGMITAKKAGLTLLGSLPLEPEIVIEGDIGSVAWMDKEDMPYTISFNKIVDMVADFTK
ncbi:MAG: ATP-binding protein [Desulfobacterium sp. 4572_20]|nr:MAG: ATP-binding protein [Desulfobacterium sp. 4572_20]